jgi:HD superfamily phosphodiesterase
MGHISEDRSFSDLILMIDSSVPSFTSSRSLKRFFAKLLVQTATRNNGEKVRLDDYLLKFDDLRTLYGLVKQDFSTRGPVHHNWPHILRDLARAAVLGEAEKANLKIVLASVLLHDIGRLYPDLDSDHHKAGVTKAPDYLRKAGFMSEEIREITHCIAAHGPRGTEEPKSLEAKVVYDVDVLSCSVGYIGVARVFDYFMREENVGVKEMVKIPSGRRGPRRDFYTETGKRTGEKGLKKAREFWLELGHELKKEEQSVKTIIPDYQGD